MKAFPTHTGNEEYAARVATYLTTAGRTQVAHPTGADELWFFVDARHKPLDIEELAMASLGGQPLVLCCLEGMEKSVLRQIQLAAETVEFTVYRGAMAWPGRTFLDNPDAPEVWVHRMRGLYLTVLGRASLSGGNDPGGMVLYRVNGSDNIMVKPVHRFIQSYVPVRFVNKKGEAP
jgi:hypothetical protein